MTEEAPAVRKLGYGPRAIWFVIGLMGVFVVLFVMWTYLEWSIYQHVYSVKAGLDWFSITFYHNYTFVAAALFSLLLINPRVNHSDLWRLVGIFLRGSVMVRRPRDFEDAEPIYEPIKIPHPGKWAWALWQVLKWAAGFVFFVINGGLVYVGNVMNPIMMLVFGMGDWSSVGRVFALPVFPASGEELVSLMPTMEIQYRVLYVILWATLMIVAVRMLLRLLSNIGTRTSDVWLGNLMVFVAAVILSFILGAPYWLMNVATPFVYGVLWTFFGLAILGWAHFRFNKGKTFDVQRSRRSVLKILGLLMALGLIVQVGALAYLYFNWNNNYLEYEWYPQTQKEITVTRWAAGLDGIKVASLLNLPTSNASTTLGLIRQWDQQAAAVTMTKAIGAYNWMTLGSSEIVFLFNKEYWVAPTSTTYPRTDWISEHLIYTHTSRIMVINTYSGAEVTPQQAFNVSSEPLIYYGEAPLSGQRGGFYNNVYVHVEGYDEIQNVSYAGEPDYTLSGWQKAMWFTFAEGQLGFAFSSQQSSIDMLFNRDVFNRVQSILIPGVVEDPSAYLASDGKNIYYVIQLYIDYPLQSGFAAGPYLRFFGVVLVNVYDGSLHGYTVSNLIGRNSTDFLTEYYERYYSEWKEAPDWLVPQLRYPEQLLGSPDIGPGQLDYDFIFHVNDPYVWRSGAQFYERPADTSVQYIPWAIGDKTYFVGMQLVNFKDSASKNLAGMYIAYGGERLGQIELYQNPSPSTTFIGPTAAKEALQTNSQVRTQLTFLPNYRIGAYLLYSVGGQLTYFVAVYTNPGTSGVVTQLPFITAVAPTTGTVAIGVDAASAYYNLLGGGLPPPGNDTSKLIAQLTSLLTSKGFSVVNATAVSPSVWINEGVISYSSAGLSGTLSQLEAFTDKFGQEAIGGAAYIWSDSSGNINLGFFHSGGQGLLQLYYVTVRFQ